MPEHHHHQSLRGHTLVEALIGMLIIGVVCLVTAQLLGALARASRHAVRQASSLSGVRKSFFSDRNTRGLLWAGREGAFATSLTTAAFSVNLSTYAFDVMAFSTGTAGLLVDDGVDVSTLGKGVSGLSVSYYHIGSNGRIAESTSAAQASLVFFALTVSSSTSRERTYSFASASWLRNHY